MILIWYRFLKLFRFLIKKCPIYIVLFASIFFLMLNFQTIYFKENDNHLMLLANRFIKGSVELNPLGLPVGDVVEFYDRRFLYFGPISSVLLIPLALVTTLNLQFLLGLFSLVVVFFSIFFWAKKLNFSDNDSLWLSIFVVFSTSMYFVSLVNISAYQVQSVAFMFVILALTEFFGKRRPILIGSLIALAGLTRITSYVAITFMLIQAFKENLGYKFILKMMLPIAVSLLLLGAYNYKRFRNPFETGYKYNMTLKNYPMNSNVGHGLFSVVHVPTNLYVLLFKPPNLTLQDGGGFVAKFPYFKADPWGMAVWYISPFLLFLLGTNSKSKYFFSSAITTTLLLIPCLTYSGIGFAQFGYRYSLDFLPFVFVILLSSFKERLSLSAKVLILIGILFNAIYVLSGWNVFPFFNIY